MNNKDDCGRIWLKYLSYDIKFTKVNLLYKIKSTGPSRLWVCIIFKFMTQIVFTWISI